MNESEKKLQALLNSRLVAVETPDGLLFWGHAAETVANCTPFRLEDDACIIPTSAIWAWLTKLVAMGYAIAVLNPQMYIKIEEY